MIEEKKKTIERKKAKKIKELKKRGTINLESIRREVYSKQRYSKLRSSERIIFDIGTKTGLMDNGR
jgi:hypothetical protein